MIDLPRLYLQWYAWTMQSGARPAFLHKAVTYYVMGADEWRYADTLEDITARHEPYFLDSQGPATDVFASGSLGLTPGHGLPDAYTVDPREVSGPEIHAEAHTTGGALTDQSVVLALAGKQLVYHSEPCAVDTDISGFFRLTAWIAIDCPDTDLYAAVYEITASGGSIRLSTDAIRARYREGLRQSKLITTQDPLRYDFEGFTFISRVISRAHRLRLVIAPMGRLLETTFAQKNYNAGGIVTDETVADARSVTVKLFHDEAHPSALYVPIGRPAVN